MDGIAALSADTSPTDGVLAEKLRHLDMETSREVKKTIAEYELKLKESKNAGVKLDVEHHITLKDDIPVSAPPRRIPYSQREEINKQIEDLLERDVLEETRSAFGAPIVRVKKRDGSLRLCVDYRRLNAKTIATPFPIPRVDDSISNTVRVENRDFEDLDHFRSLLVRVHNFVNIFPALKLTLFLFGSSIATTHQNQNTDVNDQSR